jgi:hypothetical protein
LYLLFDAVKYYLIPTKKSESNKNQILYIGEYFPVRIQRIVELVGKTENYLKTLYIAEWGYQPKLIGDGFDKIKTYRNKFHLFNQLKLEKNIRLIHAFEPKAYYQSLVLKKINVPFIYDIQDILINYFYLNPPFKWQIFNLQFEKEILQKADGFISQSLELNEAFRLHKVKINKNRLFFPLFCYGDNFKTIDYNKALKNVSLVYIGGINSLKDNSSSNFLPFIKSIQNTGVTLTIFPSPNSEKLCYSEYKNLEKDYGHFKMKKSVPFKELDLTNYHFGVVPFDHLNSEKYYSKQKYASTMKFFVYLEMGLPILISEFWEFPAWLVKRYKLGIVLPHENLPQLNDSIQSLDYHETQKNIEKFRSKYELSRYRNRLIDFYNSFLEIKI